jgi:hypothetical protein
MIKTIYLIRHGKIYKDGNFDTLSEEGLQFADYLPKLLDCISIDFIASVKGKNRCNDTVRKIKIDGIKFEEYDKIDFYYLKPYFDALKYKTSVICYGVEEISEIFKLFSIEINKENKDSFYHRIIKISINENYNN